MAKSDLDFAIDQLQVQANSFAIRFIPDARARQQYLADTQAYCRELQTDVRLGRKTARQAAHEAVQMRNLIMNAVRTETSDIGRAIAEHLKKEGKTLTELEVKYAAQMYSKPVAALAKPHRTAVWMRIIEASGAPRQSVSRMATVMGGAGRALIGVSIGLSVYEIYRAEDKKRAVAQEGAKTVGGLAGAAAGAEVGALAGVWCGPWCVGVGIIVGGAMGAMGADLALESVWR